jgi:hypothetical protein
MEGIMWGLTLVSRLGVPALNFKRGALLCGGLVCLAAPVAAQLVTPLPFGQSNHVTTALPFGQKSRSPLKPLVIRAASTMTVVAQWAMNETSGTTMTDSSGYGNNGTLYNVQTTGSGYVFDGTTSKVIVPNSASLTPGSNDFSYTVTMQTSVFPPSGTDYDLIRKGTGITTGGEFKLEVVYNRGVGKPKCVVQDSLGNTASQRGNMSVTDGLPHTITCSKTATSLTLIVDGASYPTTANYTGAITSKKPLTIGIKAPTATGVGADWYNGTMMGASVSIAQ